MATTPEDTNARKPRTWTRDELAAWLTSNDTFELAFRAGRVAPFGRPSPAMVTAIVEALAAAVPVEFREVVAGEPEAREQLMECEEALRSTGERFGELCDVLMNIEAVVARLPAEEQQRYRDVRESVLRARGKLPPVAAGEPDDETITRAIERMQGEVFAKDVPKYRAFLAALRSVSDHEGSGA